MELHNVLTSSMTELLQGLERGDYTSTDLVAGYLERIAKYDKQGPALNAVLEVNPDAWQIAQALDAERRAGHVRGPMHGIPVLVKDNIDTADKLHTSAGSLALANSYAAKDAFLVSQLRQAGAIILGKANMTEWANFMSDHMTNGYSSRGGQVLNPYGPGKFDVGGSSSGSGSSVAASLAAAAVGTETSGSILSPSSQNGIVGIKPTVGLISRSGVIPISHSQDTAGPMTRTVADAAALLSVLAGIDANDAATRASIGKTHTDYRLFLDANGLRGARIGVPREPYYEHLNDDQKQLMEKAIDVLRGLGAEVLDGVELPSAKERAGYEVLVHEFKPDLNAYLGRLGPQVPVHSLAEVIAFNEANAEVALKYGQSVMIESEKTSGSLTEAAYVEARLRDLRISKQEGIDAVVAKHQLDALLFPGYFGCFVAAKAGYPSVTVPGGYTSDGEPLGVTFTGQAFTEARLIRFAYAYEQATLNRRDPNLDVTSN